MTETVTIRLDNPHNHQRAALDCTCGWQDTIDVWGGHLWFEKGVLYAKHHMDEQHDLYDDELTLVSWTDPESSLPILHLTSNSKGENDV